MRNLFTNEAVLAHVNFSMTAFGNAHDGPLFSSIGLHGPWKCPGGAVECETDTIINCVVQKYGAKAAYPFAQCLIADGEGLQTSIPKCSSLEELQSEKQKWEAVQKCMQGAPADDIMAYAQMVTQAAAKAAGHTHMPLVLIDGLHLPCIGGCEVLPAVCEQLKTKFLPTVGCPTEFPPTGPPTALPSVPAHPVHLAYSTALKDHVLDYSPVLAAAGIKLPPPPPAKPAKGSEKAAFKKALERADRDKTAEKAVAKG